MFARSLLAKLRESYYEPILAILSRAATVERPEATLSRQFSRMAPILALVLIVGVVGAGSAAGKPLDPPESESAEPIRLDQAVKVDFEQLVNQGLLSNDVDDPSVLIDQFEMEQIIEEGQSSAPARYAGGWIENHRSVRIRLTKGPVVDAIEKIAKSSDVKVEITYDAEITLERKFSIARSDDIVSWLRSEGDSIRRTKISQRTDALIVVADKPLTPPADVQTTLSSAGMGYLVEIESEPIKPQDRGGRNMSSCTSGFTYMAPTGGRMVLARHCFVQSYYYFNGQGPFSTTYIADRWDAYADLQWRKPDVHTARGIFHAGSTGGDPRYQEGEGSAQEGSLVCHRGMNSGYSCGNVTSPYSTIGTYCGENGEYICAYSYVEIPGVNYNQAKCVPGDSGGPWSNGTRAYGIHWGGNSSVCLYSKVGYLPSNLNLIIE